MHLAVAAMTGLLPYGALVADKVGRPVAMTANQALLSGPGSEADFESHVGHR